MSAHFNSAHFNPSHFKTGGGVIAQSEDGGVLGRTTDKGDLQPRMASPNIIKLLQDYVQSKMEGE